ncbi:uncharacterized protein DNG_07507 [Cephalotrichum gorgonifer]|uniref:BZIP domain-containing protein n=1 Tax=Cephalotrichum gorgonifer TaxID=2041049 RepID=A0AAE8N2I3_9PEZI|nr:uncharacterized protein DNG_07507 [Cephalotrichum gorgonifer]
MSSPPEHINIDDEYNQHHHYQKRSSPPEAVDEQEQQGGSGKKRARGRPRVEPKDDTAADRRRTQIRLAQRAYRNRKETAIQTLEKKVNSLQDSNEEMSKAFMNLYDSAVSQGLLTSAPDFGRQLQATTEKFVALARKTSEDANASESVDGCGSIGSTGSNDAQTSRRLSDSPESTAWPVERHGPPPPASDRAESISPNQTSASLASTWAEPSHIPGVARPRNDNVVPLSAPFGYRIGKGPESTDALALRPTLDSASLPPFGTSLDAMDHLGSILDPSIPFAAVAASVPPPTLFGLLPLVPPSYSYLERTFGRRLQRSALEQGLVLIQMPSPPPHILAAVFGFCLLFEPRDVIIKRLTDTISRHTGQTLHNWSQPFFHLGGAGSFFDLVSHATDRSSDESSSPDDELSPSLSPDSANPEPPIGNQGTSGPHKPTRGVNFRMGPFRPEVEAVRAQRVDQKMRMLVPGFEGDFFDPDEVEYFLRQRGVIIPPASDFVTVEIDVNDFAVESVDVHGNRTDIATTVGGDGLGPPRSAPNDHFPVSDPSGTADGQIGGISPPMLDLQFPSQFGLDTDPFANFGSGDLPSLDTIDFNFTSLPDVGIFTGKSPQPSTRRRVTINVTTFVSGASPHPRTFLSTPP